MTKIRRIDNFQHNFSFTSQLEEFDLFFNRFLEGDLGNIYVAVPYAELVGVFGLKDAQKGLTCIFSPQGKIALMFLKHYVACSDKRLIEQLNGNIDYQFFCGINLGTNRFTNYKIVSDIRCDLAKTLNIDKTFLCLAGSYKRPS
jgi:hypothetical protein